MVCGCCESTWAIYRCLFHVLCFVSRFKTQRVKRVPAEAAGGSRFLRNVVTVTDRQCNVVTVTDRRCNVVTVTDRRCNIVTVPDRRCNVVTVTDRRSNVVTVTDDVMLLL